MKILTDLKNKLTSNIFEMAFIIVVFGMLSFIFDIDYINMSLMVAGSSIIYLLERFSRHRIRNISFLLGIIVTLSITLWDSPINLISIVLGMNLCTVFLQARNLKTKTIDISYINVIALSMILLSSGIEKFRGVNKLNESDIVLIIPVILIISYTLYLISSYLSEFWGYYKRKLKNNAPIFTTLFTAGLLLVLTAYYFKEVGADLIVIPILCGLTAFLYRKYQSLTTVLNDILDIVILIMFPYQISGYMGIGIAVVSFYTATYLLGNKIARMNTFDQMHISKFSAMLFLFAAQEIRENRGLINRLDITNGYQIGWLLISFVVIKYATSNISKFQSFFRKNDLQKLAPQFILVSVLVVFAIIMRSGRFEGAFAITTACIAYMFFYTNTRSNTIKPQVRFVNSIAGLIGSMSFLVLTTF